MKKTFISLALALSMPMNALAVSNLTAETDYADGNIKISGETEEKGSEISVIVTNPGKSISDIEQDGAVQHFKKFAAEDEKFSYSFKIHDADKNSGWMTYYVKENGGEYVKKKVYTASTNEINDLIKHILEKGTSDKITDEVFVNVFEVSEFDFYKKTDKSKLVQRIDFFLNGFVRTELEADRSAIALIVKQASLLEAFNQSADTAFLTNEGKLVSEDTYQLSQKDVKYGTNTTYVFNEILGDEGKNKVLASLKGQSYSDFDSFQKAFMTKTLLYGLNNANTLGYGHIEQILSSSNKAFLGISDLDTSVIDLQIAIATSQSDFSDASSLRTFIGNFNPVIPGTGSSVSSGVGSSSGFSSASFSDKTTVTPEVKKSAFSDLDNVSWAKEAVIALYELGIVNGKSDGVFDPDGYITREELTKIIAKAFNYEYSEYTLPFFDVDMTKWYAPYVSAAFEKGIIKGISETEFGTGKNVTRQDLCVMLYRVMGEPEVENKLAFSDNSQISDYAQDAISYLTGLSAVSGFEDGSFKPLAACTRAQTAKIVYGILSAKK